MSREHGEGAYLDEMSAEMMRDPSSPVESPPPEPIEIDDSFSSSGDNKFEEKHAGEPSPDRMREDDNLRKARSDAAIDAEPALFLVKFVHDGCPRACDPFLAVDLAPILRHRYRDDPPASFKASSAESSARTRAKARKDAFEEVMNQVFERNGAALALRVEHPNEKRSDTAEGDTVVTYTEPFVSGVRIFWGRIPDGRNQDPSGGPTFTRGFGRSPDLYDMGDLRAVQWQLELMRWRGCRDLLVVRYETLEYTGPYPAATSPGSVMLEAAEEEGCDNMADDNNNSRSRVGTDSGNMNVSPSLGVGPGGGTRGNPFRYEFSGIRSSGNRDDYDDDDNDAWMGSPPHPPHNPSPTLSPPPPSNPNPGPRALPALLINDDIMNTTTKDLDDILDLEQEGPRYRGHSPSVGPSGIGDVQQGKRKHAGEQHDDGYFGPDSQGQIW
ncbi:hypothetical protein PG990_008468 [Apiospora arundinis]